MRTFCYKILLVILIFFLAYQGNNIINANEKLTKEDDLEIVKLVVLDLLPPNTLDQKHPLSISLDIEGENIAHISSETRTVYPTWVPFIKNRNDFVIDNQKCFIDSQLKIPAVGIGIGPRKIAENNTVLLEAGNARCVMGTTQYTYTLKKSKNKWKIIKRDTNLTI